MTKLTIADIALRAGVSKATVSRVLNNRPQGVGAETRARIQAIVDETGFQPSAMARCLATGRSRSVGLLIPEIANPFYAQLASGAEETLNEAGYSVFLCNAGRDLTKEKSYIDALIDKRVDGVILDSAGSDCDCHLNRLAGADIPVVLLDRAIGNRAARYGVFVDNHEGALLAIDRLLKGGVRRLLFVNGPAELSQPVERLAGVRAAMAAAGVAAENLTVINADFSLDGGRAAVAARLRDLGGVPDYDAVFAANDVMAIGALKALQAAGIDVPAKVEVMGFDDIELAALVEPPLSTVSQPTREMGSAGAQLLLRLINGEKPRKKTVVMRPRLVLRGTTRNDDKT